MAVIKQKYYECTCALSDSECHNKNIIMLETMRSDNFQLLYPLARFCISLRFLLETKETVLSITLTIRKQKNPTKIENSQSQLYSIFKQKSNGKLYASCCVVQIRWMPYFKSHITIDFYEIDRNTCHKSTVHSSE